MLKIHSVETFGTHEGPGIRLVIFMQGCLMKCLYCHNPDTIKLNGGIEMTNSEIISLAEKSKAYFGRKGGLTFSGGECLLQAKELLPLFIELKNLNYNIVIDTNGFLFNEDVEELLKYTDLVLLDIKHFYDEEHKRLTGVSNENVLFFANYLEKINKPFWIRHVLVPGFTDNEKHLNDLGNYFADFKSLEKIDILPYHTLGVYKWKELGMEYGLEGVVPPTTEQLEKAKQIFEKYVEKVFIRR